MLVVRACGEIGQDLKLHLCEEAGIQTSLLKRLDAWTGVDLHAGVDFRCSFALSGAEQVGFLSHAQGAVVRIGPRGCSSRCGGDEASISEQPSHL